MFKRLSLKGYVFTLLAATTLTILLGGAVVLWYSYRVGDLLTTVVDGDFKAYEAAENLSSALMEQKGLTTYFMEDGDPGWLAQLAEREAEFSLWLVRARGSADGAASREILGRIEGAYRGYVHDRALVIDRYRRGDREQGLELHRRVREAFTRLYDLCRQYKTLHEARIQESRDEAHRWLQMVGAAAVLLVPLVLGFSGLLAWVFVRHVLTPIRRMTEEGDFGDGGELWLADEMRNLGRRVNSLLEDVDFAQSKLQKSREHLEQSEKWALTGKLAAGVAHSIRNPLTSVKIRLFSLGRSLRLNDEQREDFEVITEEITHIDAISRNFLEFSRPPKLKMQDTDPGDVVDNALTLVRHRLDSYGVEARVVRGPQLPRVLADPEQLKEVLVNLLVNACEAMPGGGRITISLEGGFINPPGVVAVIRVADNGPGIPRSMKDEVFQPFFSSKEEGTGLGLSIAWRIVEEHGGWITVKSQEGEGATFVITLPGKEDGEWRRS
ncbi:sensor histidine kinase [Desulfocurvus sp. DL9XJH121]